MKKILTLAFVSLLAVSCSKFLDLQPEDTYTVDNTYKVPQDFEYAIAGVYASQQKLFNTGECWFRMTFTRGDEVRAGAGGTNSRGLSTFTETSNVPVLESTYKIFWEMITRANTILGKIRDIEFQDETQRDRIMGEAYALRGWAFYNLAWQYGGMPLIDEVIPIGQTMVTPRSTQEATLSFAAEDLRLSCGLLPEKWNDANVGRVTRYGALAVLGRLYMFTHQYKAAQNCFQQVIDSDLYAMEDNYADCFIDSHDNGCERVWEVQFTGGQCGEGQAFITGLLPEGYNSNNDPNALMPFNGYSSAMRVAMDLVEAYEEGDVRKDASLVTDIVVNGVKESVYSYVSKYVRYNYKPQAKDDWANNLPIVRYTDVLMMYAEALNEQAYSSNGKAMEILNRVRSRAGLRAYRPSDIPDQEAFRQAIRKERRVEFAFEGIRWQDLLRWDYAMEAMQLHFQHADNGGAYSMQSYNVLFPIPYAEIVRYNNRDIMWQNPGY